MDSKNKSVGRRTFLRNTATLAAGTALGTQALFCAPSLLRFWKRPESPFGELTLGVITYSFRSMPEQNAEAILRYVKESGIGAIELMGDPAEAFAGKPENPVDRRAYFGLRRKQRDGEELSDNEQKELAEMQEQAEAYNAEVARWRLTASPEKFRDLKEMFREAGIHIYAFKPNAFGMEHSDAEMDYGFRMAKILGASHVTLEHPGHDAHTRKLGDMGKKHGIYVAYHGHEQQTPTFWDTALDQSAYNALNLDLGHYVAAGNPSPLDLIIARNERIRSMHLKDRQRPENGKLNLPWGEGNTPIAEVLQLMKKKGYTFPATIELEYDIPEGSDAVREVKKCLAYCQAALS